MVLDPPGGKRGRKPKLSGEKQKSSTAPGSGTFCLF